MAIVLPESFGRYRILEPLGEGGMGAVFLAKDTQLDRLVALKVPKLEESATADSDALRRFLREARSAATLSHPNICPIYDIGEFSGTPYLTMAYIEGKPLSALVEPGKPMDQRRATEIVRMLARAMEEAHGRGVIHRDLKPSNVMMTARGEPVIMDFGLALREESIETNLTKSGALLGTPAYMAPEQIEGGSRAAGSASDIYSLGVILYQLLTSRLPFQGSVMKMLGKILYESPDPPSKYRPDLDHDLEAICLKAMAKQAEDRYTTMADLAVALERKLDENRGEKARRWSLGSRLLAVAVVCAAVLLAAYVLNDSFFVGRVQIILSEPDAAVEVLLDGTQVDRARLGEPLRLQPGEHRLAVRGDGYQPWSQSITVQRGSNSPVTVTLAAAPAQRAVGRGEERNEKKAPLGQVSAPGRSLPPFAGQEKRAGSVQPPSATSTTERPPPPPAPSPPAPTKGTDSTAARRDSQSRSIEPAKNITNRIGMRFVLIPAGSFQMGSPEGEGEADEHPRHEVRISRPFYLSIHEVTQGQYLAVTGKNPSWFSARGGGKEAVKTPSTDEHPVETVSWFDAMRFSNMLSEREGLAPFYTVAEPSVQVHDWAGPGYRLPTEAEWEYACRASSQMRYSFSDVATELSRYAWFSDFSGQVTHPVGQKLANTWGLYDMHGNVWEWCWDWYSADYYKHSTSVDARGPEQANFRVRRGGSFGDSPADLRSAVRTRLGPMIRSRFVGFRLARTCD